MEEKNKVWVLVTVQGLSLARTKKLRLVPQFILIPTMQWWAELLSLTVATRWVLHTELGSWVL